MTQLLFNILLTTSLYLLISFSFKVIYETIRFMPLSHAITLTIAPYFVYLFMIELSFNIYLSILFSIILSILLSLLTYLLIYKQLQKRLIESWQMLISSLGVYIIFQNLISIYFEDDTKSFRNWPIREGYKFLGAYMTGVQLITIFTTIFILFLSYLFIESTKFGKELKAISSNVELSSLFGISLERAILFSFILGSGLASIAGILISADSDMTPTMGFNWLLYGVIAMIIGGVGKMRYLFLGSLLLSSAQHFSAYYFDSKWMNATAFFILILFLFFKPYGFSGIKLKKADI